jgi:hypothetical protein
VEVRHATCTNSIELGELDPLSIRQFIRPARPYQAVTYRQLQSALQSSSEGSECGRFGHRTTGVGELVGVAPELHWMTEGFRKMWKRNRRRPIRQNTTR